MGYNAFHLEVTSPSFHFFPKDGRSFPLVWVCVSLPGQLKCSFLHSTKCSHFSFSRPHRARSWACLGSLSPHCVEGQGSTTDWVVQLAYRGVGTPTKLQRSAAVPVTICPLWVEYNTKIFLVFLQPLLCLLPEYYLDWKEVEEVNALRLLEQLRTTPLLPGCTFFMTVIQRQETDIFCLQGFLFN